MNIVENKMLGIVYNVDSDNNMQKAAQCAAITQEVAIEFNKWLNGMSLDEMAKEVGFKNHEQCYQHFITHIYKG